jgi:hypothetical protein
LSTYNDSAVFYIVHVLDDVPCIKTSLLVRRDLSISICVCGKLVDSSKCIWVMGDGAKLDCWSKLIALFSHVQSIDKTASANSVQDKISDIIKVLSDICDDEIDVCVDDDE